MKLEITVIDDSLNDALALEKLLYDAALEPGLEIAVKRFTDPKSALSAIDRDAESNRIVFADVMMPGLSGTELIPLLRERAGDAVLFVLTSSQHGFMKDGYVVEAFDFLCKPFSREDITAILRRAEKRFRSNTGWALTFYADKTNYRIEYADIIAITVERNYASLITPERRYCFRTTVKRLLETLPDQFVRISGNTIVNIARVTSISPKKVTLRKDNISLDVAKTYFDRVLEAFKSIN